MRKLKHTCFSCLFCSRKRTRIISEKFTFYKTRCYCRTVHRNKRLVFSYTIIMNALGGTGMNSRLNLNIREKYGLAYNIEASYTPYSDTGVFTIYFGCDAGDLDKCLRLCRKEMAALGEELLGYNQLRKAKNQMIGQITLASENYENMMLSSGKSFLIYDKVDELEAVCEEVGGITPELLRQVAREIFAQDKQSVLIYK